MMKILFVCKYNRFRSRVADAYFKKINKNNKIKSSSAGIIIGNGAPLDNLQLMTAKKNGFNINGRLTSVSEQLLKKQDLVVIVADDVPICLFDGFSEKMFKFKVIRLPIVDTASRSKNVLDKKVKSIMKSVDKFNENLEKGKWK